MKKLKILLVAHKFPPFMGGIEMHTFEVGRRMAALAHSVTVLTADNADRLPREEMMSGMRVVRVPARPKGSDLFFAPGIYREVTRGSWDVIHVQGFHTFVPPLALFGAVRSGATVVMTFHSGGHSSSWRNQIRNAQRAILRPLITRADRLIAVSEFEAELFAKGLRVAREQIVVVPNGAEIDAASGVAPADPRRPLILTVGRLEKYKGHQRVIAAFAELLKFRPQAQLRVLGEGPYKNELVALVDKLGLQGRVTIGGIPSQERRRMGDMLSRASAIVLLSDYEAHPVAALEAISLGRPVLASNSTGFAEMVAKGQVRGIDPDTAPAIVARAILEEVDREPTDRPKFAIATWDDCARNLVEVYRDTLSRKNKGRSVGRDPIALGRAPSCESETKELERELY